MKLFLAEYRDDEGCSLVLGIFDTRELANAQALKFINQSFSGLGGYTKITGECPEYVLDVYKDNDNDGDRVLVKVFDLNKGYYP